MGDTFINFHSYLIVNAAIAFAYMISRMIIHLPYFKINMSQFYQLKLARYCLVFAIFIFLLMPNILSLLPNEYYSHFQLKPIFQGASSNFLSQHTSYYEKIQLNVKESNFSIYHFVMIIILFIGIGIYFIKSIKNFFFLRNFQKESFCQHKINNIHILLNEKCEIPFCWGYFTKYFIALPNSMLEKNRNIRLVIRHELQHIRQGDTHWLHVMTMIKWFCFWNPFIWKWINLCYELQELSCDESMILRTNTISPRTYAECLLNVAKDYLNHTPHEVIGIHQLSKSFLYRRINMLFSYKRVNTTKKSIIFVYFILLFASLSAAFALNGTIRTPLSIKQINEIVEESHMDKNFLPEVRPEVVNEINHIRSSEKERLFMRASLRRMKKYEPAIQPLLKEETLPNDLLVIPLVESGYQALDQSKNRVLAAGIWQIIPESAKRLGLTINHDRDDRLDTKLSTKAALYYLKSNYTQFQNWKLALLAYEIGEKNTDRLIKKTGSRDVWTLAYASSAGEVKEFLARLDALLIIMHNPSLV